MAMALFIKFIKKLSLAKKVKGFESIFRKSAHITQITQMHYGDKTEIIWKVSEKMEPLKIEVVGKWATRTIILDGRITIFTNVKRNAIGIRKFGIERIGDSWHFLCARHSPIESFSWRCDFGGEHKDQVTSDLKLLSWMFGFDKNDKLDSLLLESI